MQTIGVRQATVSDLDVLTTLFNEYRVFQGRDSDETAARAFLLDRFNHGQSVVFIAYRGATPIGFAQLFPSFSSVALARVFILNDLFVRESDRRAGAATALLAAVETHAWALGSVRVSLNVAKGNFHAQQLYASRGWQQDEQYLMFHRFPTPRQ